MTSRFDRLSRLAGSATGRQFGEPVKVFIMPEAVEYTVTGIFTENHEVLSEGDGVQLTTRQPVIELQDDVTPTAPGSGDEFEIRGQRYVAVDELPGTTTTIKLHLHRK